MTTMLVLPPQTLILTFLKSDGKILSTARLYDGKVFESNLVMDTKHGHVYIVFQIPHLIGKVVYQNKKFKHYPYIIVFSKANATGGLLPFEGNPDYVRYVVGYTRERNAHITGYFDEENGW